MKKPLVVLIIVFIVGIVGLQIFTYQQPEEAYTNLKEQFNLYLGQDVSNDGHFADYINLLTYEHTSENLQIQIQTGSVIVTQSAIIVGMNGRTVYALTDSTVFDSTKHQTITVHDYKNRVSSGSFIVKDNLYPIALIQFSTSYFAELNVVEYIEHVPVENEIISSISSANDILNYVSLGTFESKSSDDRLYVIDMIEDPQMIGASVYDINLHLIGMRIYQDNAYYVISSNYIKNFVILNT